MTSWYSYPTDARGTGYGEIPEPLNASYRKPDTNIARYASFNYLGSSGVHVGQSIQPGQQIGTAGSPTGINFGLGLGADPSWGGRNFSQYQGRGDSKTDPRIVLSSLASGKTPSGTGLLAFGVSNSLAGTYFGTPFISVSNNINQTLNNVPGFLGLVEALDEAETFVPFRLVSTGGQDIGILGHLPFIGGGLQSAADQITLPADQMQAILVFVTSNTLAAIVRFIIIFIGVMILVALVLNALGSSVEQTTGQTPGQLASTAIRLSR